MTPEKWTPEQRQAAAEKVCYGGEEEGKDFFLRHADGAWSIAVNLQCALTAHEDELEAALANGRQLLEEAVEWRGRALEAESALAELRKAAQAVATNKELRQYVQLARNDNLLRAYLRILRAALQSTPSSPYPQVAAVGSEREAFEKWWLTKSLNFVFDGPFNEWEVAYAAWQARPQQVTQAPDPEVVERLLSAINWACGCSKDDFRSRMDGEGAYWWRAELIARAALQYNGARYEVRK